MNKRSEFSELTIQQQLKFAGDRPCGARIKFLGVRMEKILFQLGFDVACRRHDFEYFRGRTLLDKLKADFNFLDNMVSILRKNHEAWKIPLVFLYFLAVILGGWGFHFANEYRTIEEILEIDQRTQYKEKNATITTKTK